MDEKRHGAEDHICEGCWNDASEPDVLERGKVYFDEHFTEEGPIPRELCSDVEQLLADAIAEIKELLKRSERQSARFESVCEIHKLAEADLLKAYEDTEQLEKVNRSLVEANFTLIEQLREYTEAEVVWQARRIVYGHAFGWSGIHKSEVDDYTNRRNCEVRALAVVSPKGESTK